MHFLRVTKRARFVQLPVEIPNNHFSGLDDRRAVRDKKSVVFCPVFSGVALAVGFRGQPGCKRIRFAVVYPAIVIADVDPVLGGLLAGGGRKGFGFPRPMVDQELGIVAVQIALVVDVQCGAALADDVDARGDLRAGGNMGSHGGFHG